MTNLTSAKLAVGAVAVGIWVYGVRVGDDRLEWVGIGLLVAAFLLRLLNSRQRS